MLIEEKQAKTSRSNHVKDEYKIPFLPHDSIISSSANEIQQPQTPQHQAKPTKPRYIKSSQHNKNLTKMKATTILVLLTTLASTTLASPVNSSPNPKPADALASREVCYHPGECGWDQSGQCEYHCGM